VFRTVIPRNVRLAEAPSFGKAALYHDRESRGALAYLALAGELIRREEEEAMAIGHDLPDASGESFGVATATADSPALSEPSPVPEPTLAD